MSMNPPAGWYPEGTSLRWWDGSVWTEHRQAAEPVAPVRFDTTTVDYRPSKPKKLERLLAQGWEVVSTKNRFGAVSTATLRRPK